MSTASPNNPPAVVWFRNDLRLHDNPALQEACARGEILPVFILDDINAGPWALGGASRWWLHQSLAKLRESLQGRLWLFAGDPLEILPRFMAEHHANAIYWNRSYEPWQVKRDRELKLHLEIEGIEVHSYKANLLFEPWENLKGDGSCYKVFTPFYRNAIQNLPVATSPKAAPQQMQIAPCAQADDSLTQLVLLSSTGWHRKLEAHWSPGEAGALNTLEHFLESGLWNYPEGRDFPAQQSVSRLSPHLRFGEVSPGQLWHAVTRQGLENGSEEQAEQFKRQLIWREFSAALLYHFPTISHENMNARFDRFPWQDNDELLQRWQRGETGYPLIDAGMRELWQTGYMHNRVRMIVGSFLVKNLRLHWHHGARWFWDCLLDADLANNSCSWQWVAGCGTDAAPYFRIFNPLTQSQKFDPKGEYIRSYVPELSRLSDREIHEPSALSQQTLTAAGIELGNNYPEPVVDLKASRENALEAYQQTK